MGDGSLSQEEIDALLQGADDLGASLDIEVPTVDLTDVEIKALRSLSSEMAQSMGITLSTITTAAAEIKVSSVDLFEKKEYASQFTGELVQITADYIEGAPGKHSYVMSRESANQIAALLMAQEEGELTEMSLSALIEGFSQMSGAAIIVIKDKTGKEVKTTDLRAISLENASGLELPEGKFVRVRYNLTSNGNSSFLDEIYEIGVAKELVGVGAGMAAPAVVQQPQAFTKLQPTEKLQSFGSRTQPQASIGVQPVQFPTLSQVEHPGVSGNIGLLMDVSMQLTVELGRTKMLIKDILGMGEGTIVELDKLAGEPVDLLVNGKLIAKGEVVVIDENFGVRVTDIISPMERISNLE
ncbi:MAG: flagellar motor switch protein FliN [Spirochaetota bacterium]